MKILGSGSTFSDQLHKLGKKLFKSKFNGVFPSDGPKSKKGFSIYNTDNGTGEHWLAIVNDGDKIYFYDSFGRQKDDLSPFFIEKEWIITDKKPEQTFDQKNCGARVISFLESVEKYGIDDVIKVL